MTDPRVTRLTNPEDCESFAKNAEDRGHPEIAQQARRAGVLLRAAKCGATTVLGLEVYRCVFAFEEARRQETGRRARANRTRKSILEKGMIATVERAVSRAGSTEGWKTLSKAGLLEFTFEAVVLRYPESFAPATVERAAKRLD